MSKMKTCWALVAIILACSDAAKILVVFSLPGRSHGNLGDGLVRHLLNAGHEVTYISPFGYKNAPDNLRMVDVSKNMELMPKEMMSIKTIMNKQTDMNILVLVHMMTALTRSTIENSNVQKLLNDPKEQFDVVIAEWMFSDVPAGFAAVFNCPLIWLSSVEIHWQLLQLIDEPTNPSYTVDIMSPYTPPLNFFQRVAELWNQIRTQALLYFYLNGVQDDVYQTTIIPVIEKRGRKPPTFDEVRYNASMVLSNAYVSTSGSISAPQSHKYIGGYHIDDTVKPLPQDLQKLMDNAKNGVIYFSMGSNLKSKDMPEEMKVSLLRMFGTLKQTVLWKFEEVLPNRPENVHILEWAPQQSILSHPNLVVFITHGGLLSTTEAVHFGVPIIGIPVFADQFMNVDKAVRRGFAQRVDLSFDKMADDLKKAIGEVTSNPRYAAKAKELSVIHHDRPVPPGQELVHWVNHVVRTRGAPHLRSAALDLPFYKRKYLDLAAVLAGVLVAVLVLMKRVCAFICPKKGSSKKKTN